MPKFYERFLKSIAWNSFESIIYHILLLGHHIALFRVLDYTQFGTIGTVFSSIYLIITLADIGLQLSLPPFFKRLCTNRSTAKSTLLIQSLPTYLLLCFFCMLIYHSPKIIWLPTTLTTTTLLLICGILFTEYSKKLARSILHLAFFNQQTALVELLTIVSYVGIVWSWHLLGLPLTLNAILVPMLVTSTISMMLLMLYVSKWYYQLPDSSEEISKSINKNLLRSRMFTYGNQLGATLFSGNFLVPLMASYTGIGPAGIFKFVSMIFHYISIVLHAIFGTSSSALFASSKDEPLETKRILFSHSTGHLYHALCSIGIFIAINYKVLFSLGSLGTFEYGILFAMLFMAVRMVENLFITYEKFYITEERSELILFLNLLTMGLTYVFAYCIPIAASFLSLIMLLITMRFIMLLVLGIYSFYVWKLRPLTKFHPVYFFTSLVASLLFFVASRLIML